MRFTLPLALATATAFSVSTLPVRAMPAAGVNLFRIDAEGVQPLPDLQKLKAALEARDKPTQGSLQSPESASEPLISQAGTDRGADSTSSGVDVTLMPTGIEDWKICFNGPLPVFDAWEYLSIRNPVNDAEVETIPLTSSRISYSQDRTCITIDPEFVIKPGEKFCALLPDGPNPLPRRVDPCCFAVAPPAAPAAPAASTAPPNRWWIIPLVIGGAVGICALAGCFNGGNNGDSNGDRNGGGTPSR